MKSNVVFLDIDGVVNTLQISNTPFKKGTRSQINREGFYFLLCHEEDELVSDEQAVMWLNKLCLETNSKIVISSSWRRSGLDKCIAALRNSGLDYTIDIIGMTPTDGFSYPRLGYWQTRGTEISNWLLQHKDEVNNFVILDDDRDMDDLIDHLVLCNSYYGFKYPEYVTALDILKKI